MHETNDPHPNSPASAHDAETSPAGEPSVLSSDDFNEEPTVICWDLLVVEDDDVLREQLAESFRDESYSVATARNGAEALAILKGARVGVVLLDLMLPVMTGWELLEEVKRTQSLQQMPIFVITAVSNAHRAPSGPVFLKPLNLHSLRRAVRAYLGDRC